MDRERPQSCQSACYLPPVKIAVVIPALDEAEEIAGAVASARAADVEVVVVDGGSRDGTRARAEAAGARVFRAAPGRAHQLDVGARGTASDVVLFLHADSRLPPGFAAAVRGALRDEAVAGGAFRLRFGERRPALRLVEWGARLRVALLRLPYGDQAIFLRRAVLEALGGVPQAPIMEDLDLVREIRRRGKLVRLALPVVTSARRYRAQGVLRTMARNALAAAAWRIGCDRGRIAAWYGR